MIDIDRKVLMSISKNIFAHLYFLFHSSSFFHHRVVDSDRPFLREQPKYREREVKTKARANFMSARF